MLIQQSIHLHTSVKYLAKVQNALLLTVFIKTTAESFVGVFIPIFFTDTWPQLKSRLYI